jgi:hypothetical protein
MNKPDDIKAGFNAILNQIPGTMEASIGVMSTLSRIGSVKGEDGEIDLGKLQQLVNKLLALTTFGLITLDNKAERLAGRPGIPDDLIETIMSEFCTGGS